MRRLLMEKKLEKVTYVLEMIIAVLIAIGVCIGLFDLGKYFIELFIATPDTSYEIFQSFLAYALILIVGIELILMILYHSTEAILELILFVIARKMLIYSHTMMDLVLGTLAIAMVFATLKYLVAKQDKDIVKRESFACDGSTNIEDIMSNTGLYIPTQTNNPTVASFISKLAAEEQVAVTEGTEFEKGDALIKVMKTDSQGRALEVIFTDNGKPKTKPNAPITKLRQQKQKIFAVK